jgi:glucosamine kinase
MNPSLPILIADSGGTKADWCLLCDNGKHIHIQTSGMNAYFHQQESIEEILHNELKPHLPDDTQIQKVYFYGSGFGLPEKKKLICSAIQNQFPNAKVEAFHDLMGACRALAGRSKGIVCILGTGASASLYDGSDIVSKPNSWGYILGDEGGGAHLGRKVLMDYLHKKMPENLCSLFAEKYTLSRDIILENVYQKSFPNRYLAGFSRFLRENLEEEYCKDVVREAFIQFLDLYVLTLQADADCPAHFTGSIAYYYQSMLTEVLSTKSIPIGKILPSPLAGLEEYHLINF